MCHWHLWNLTRQCLGIWLRLVTWHLSILFLKIYLLGVSHIFRTITVIENCVWHCLGSLAGARTPASTVLHLDLLSSLESNLPKCGYRIPSARWYKPSQSSRAWITGESQFYILPGKSHLIPPCYWEKNISLRNGNQHILIYTLCNIGINCQVLYCIVHADGFDSWKNRLKISWRWPFLMAHTVCSC